MYQPSTIIMGVARIFQRGGHTDSYRGYSSDCHLNIVSCLLTKRLTKGGGDGHPRASPGYAYDSSGAPAAQRAAKRSPIIIEKGTTRMHRNRNPCNPFLMVKMASGMDHGRVRPTTTTTTNDVAQHGGHPANTKSCSLGLQHISLILDMHIMCN